MANKNKNQTHCFEIEKLNAKNGLTKEKMLIMREMRGVLFRKTLLSNARNF
jgi:hypothetical protein